MSPRNSDEAERYNALSTTLLLLKNPAATRLSSPKSCCRVLQYVEPQESLDKLAEEL